MATRLRSDFFTICFRDFLSETLSDNYSSGLSWLILYVVCNAAGQKKHTQKRDKNVVNWRVKKPQKVLLDFEIDSLTNSIVNTFTGDSFPTDITRLTKADLKVVTKKFGWLFNWTQELKKNERDVYKLTIVNNPTVIQGLISFTVKEDNVFMHWLRVPHLTLVETKYMKGLLVI